MTAFFSKSRFPTKPPPRWFWISSLSLLLLGIAFFVLSLVVGARESRFFVAIIPVVLVGALLLHAYYLLHAGRDFYTTDREFASIFEHALDGILILDDRQRCLNANPAALRILAASREELLGSSFSSFFKHEWEFTQAWNSLLEGRNQRGQMELVRYDNSSVSVDYAIAANYVPGRHVAILCDTTERRLAEDALRQSQQLLQEVTDHVQEVVWMFDTDTLEVLYVSLAYEAVTGHSLHEIDENPSSYQELLHPEDRDRVLAKLEESRRTGKLDEEFRIVRPDGAVRWIWSKGAAPGQGTENHQRLFGIAQDITERKQAEFEIARHLSAVEAARSEAEALRLATLTLTKNLRMDAVLDTLLASLAEIVPYEAASVILTDGDALAVARTSAKTVEVLEGEPNRYFERVRVTRKSVLVRDTRQEATWEDTHPLSGVRSWICVPLVAATERLSERVLGLLSVCHSSPNAFSSEHFRVAQSLGISAAVAIQNARLYERAEIYAAELESLVGREGRRQARKANADA